MSTAIQENLLTATATIDLQAAEGKPAKVSIVAYTGGVFSPPGFGPTIVDTAGIQAANPLTLLADHENKLNAVLGSGESTIHKGQILVAGTLADSDAGRQAISLHKSGVALQASIGLVVDESRRLKAGEIVTVNNRTIKVERPTLLVTRGRLREVTVTPLGVDAGTSVSIAAKKESRNMSTETNLNVEDIQATERDRFQKIEAACKAPTGGWGSQSQAVDELKASAIAGDIEINELQSKLLASYRSLYAVESRPMPPAAHIKHGESSGLNQDSLEASLLIKAGKASIAEQHFGERTLNAAQKFSRFSQVDMARQVLQASGMETPAERHEIVNQMLTAGTQHMLKASLGVSTLSMPVALGNAAHKVSLMTYRETSNTWRSFCDVKSAANFKKHQSLRPSLVDGLEEVGRDGELKHSSMDESVYEYQVGTYGRIVSYSRQTVINDDLGLLEETAPLMGKAAARKVSDKLYELVLSNPGNYFSTSNKNLLASNALSHAGLAAAVEAMRTKKDKHHNDIDLVPQTLLVPPSLESYARSLLTSELTERVVENTGGLDEVRPTGNSLQGVASLQVDQRLQNTSKFTGASPTSWYLFSAPSDAPFVVGFLDGIDAPRVEYFGLETNADILAVRWRVYLDFGVAAGDNVAAVKCEA